MAARMCKVTVDGEIREYKAGTTYQEIAADFQPHYEHQIVLVFAGGIPSAGTQKDTGEGL